MRLRKLECSGELTLESEERSKQKAYRAVRLLELFAMSGAELAEIADWSDEYRSIYAVRDTFNQAIKRASLEEEIMCCSIKGVLYLVRL